MKVRVRIPEFTWHDESGYHTVAHVGEVPADHPAIKAALAAGYLVPSDPPADNPKPKIQNPKSKEA
jgi:hypothetical protein